MLTEWIHNTGFAYPWVLAFLVLLPVLALEYFRRQKRASASMLVTTTHFMRGTGSFRASLRHLPFILRLLAIALLILAAARPRQEFAEEQVDGQGIDIVLCFDISGSMTEKDFTPNRLEAAKQVASEFVKGRPGDRLGVVIFSNQSFTLCPLTTDHQTVLDQIANVQSGYLQDEGTAIGSGLATSVDRLRTDSSKSKAIILLTDGVDFGGVIPPDIARDMARLYHIRIYCIGIGSEREIEETEDSPLGPVTHKKRLEFNESLLKDLSEKTGGQYFHAADADALRNIYASIDRLEKSSVKMSSYPRYTDKFLPLAIAAIAILLVEFLLRYTLLRKFP